MENKITESAIEKYSFPKDARPPRLSSRPACHRSITAYTPNAGMRGNGGQAPRALHHIIARGIGKKRGTLNLGRFFFYLFEKSMFPSL